MRVSAVVVSHGHADDLREALPLLAPQVDEIVIVANAPGSLPPDVAAARVLESPAPRGFGSIRVAATIGRTRWNTSIFPDAKSGSYVLPVKKQVRQAEHATAGDEVHGAIEVDV